MPRGGRIGPPHITRARQSFSALDMFNQLTSFPETGLPEHTRLHQAGDNARIHAAGANNFRIHQ